MYLSKIRIINFKNIKSADLVFSNKFNCISGNNGEGKTNLLDAVYYLSMTKSFFNNTDEFSILFGKDNASLNGTYIREDNSCDVIGINIGADKFVKRNEKIYARRSDHIGLIPVVMVSPADISLISESGEERRKFMNSILSQMDKEYLRKIQNYNQLLQQRNKLLKSSPISFDLLDVISERMSLQSDYIYNSRKVLTNELNDYIDAFYRQLSGGKEKISISYCSDLDKRPLEQLLIDSKEKDMLFKYTTVGIQRDDLEFLMNGHPIKKTGSQGQQKSFLVSLKLSQFSIMKQVYGKAPILLLDDVFDKLDMERVEYLLNLVSADDFGQIFITDSNKVRINKILKSTEANCKHFVVKEGVYLSDNLL